MVMVRSKRSKPGRVDGERDDEREEAAARFEAWA